MKGRKPIPNALRIAKGARVRNRGAPEPDSIAPHCPEFLDDCAKDEWNRMSALLLSNRILTELDGSALAAYCQIYSRWADAEKQLREFGTVILSPDKQFPIQSPYLAIANRAIEQMAKMLIEFGLTPSSRTRIKTSESTSDNHKAGYFKPRIARSGG